MEAGKSNQQTQQNSKNRNTYITCYKPINNTYILYTYIQYMILLGNG